MDHLTRQQIVLLCLLVSFVTAVATGITIFSLGDNSTGTSGQSIAYRVIEKTIEQVASDSPVRQIISVPAPTPAPAQSTDMSISDIAAAGSGSLIRIYKNDTNASPEFITLGAMVGGNEIISQADDRLFQSGAYITILSNKKQYQITFDKSLGSDLDLLHLSDPTAVKLVPSLSVKNASEIKIGTNVVALGGTETSNVVSTGIVKETEPDTATGKSVTSFITDFKPSTNIASLLLFDTNANLIGIYTDVNATSTTADEGTYLSASDLLSATK